MICLDRSEGPVISPEIDTYLPKKKKKIRGKKEVLNLTKDLFVSRITSFGDKPQRTRPNTGSSSPETGPSIWEGTCLYRG